MGGLMHDRDIIILQFDNLFYYDTSLTNNLMETEPTLSDIENEVALFIGPTCNRRCVHVRWLGREAVGIDRSPALEPIARRP
ncbi:hypothetical protein EVAR_22339_1 [Eumeta japonica]|uniref:Uncharacterized protein n=1 Tax=Eumeta variegata TaxID=151549 RepID=A0A4C1VJI8_EUMVA|nr:hypothetical protein EVAR_22339_1 [Eumeta japonica]